LKYSTFDQAVVSATSFLVSVLVARWGSPLQYGAYSTAQSFYLLGAGFHNALVIEPLGVIAPRALRAERRSHLVAAARYSTVLAIVCGAAVAVLAEIFIHSILLTAAVAVASPLLISQIFVRRVCYAVDNQRAALAGSAAFLLIAISGLYLLHTHFLLTGGLAYVALACGAIAAMLASGRWLNHSLGPRETEGNASDSIARSYLNFGSWLAISCLVGWLNAGIYVPMVSKYLGLVQAGTLRAAEMLFTPIDQFMASVAILLIPLLSAQEVTGKEGVPTPEFPFTRLQWLIGGGTLLYGVIMFYNSHFFLHLFYGGSTFSAADAAVPGIGVSIIANGVSTSGPGMKLRISGNTRGLFLAGLAGAVISVAIGIPLMMRYGIAGAAGGRAAASLGNLAVATQISRMTK